MAKEILNMKEIPTNPAFTFITTNQEKLAAANLHLEPFGITFDNQSMDLIEPQADSVEVIAQAKAEQAYETIKAPVVVTDHNWSIPALNGFPGPYMKFINQWFSTEDMQNLMRPHTDKTIIKSEVLCYKDSLGTVTIKCDMSGSFVDTPRGEGLSTMRIVSLLPSGKTVAECIADGTPISEQYSLWEDFAEWYSTNRT